MQSTNVRVWTAPLILWTAGMFLVEIVFFVLNFAEPTGPPILGTAPVILGSAFTAVAMFRAWKTPGLSKPAGRFWRSMTLASAGITVVQLTDLPGYIRTPSVTPNPVSLTVYAAALTVIIVSLYRLPLATPGPGSGLRLMLDCATVTLAAVLVIWYAALNQTSAADLSKVLATTTFASVALALVVLALAKVHFTAGRTIDPRALRCLGAGLSVQMIGVFVTPLILDRPQIAGEPVGRAAMYVLVSAAAAYQCRAASATDSVVRPRERTFSPVPYLAVTVVDAFLLWAIRDQSVAVRVIGGGAVGLTVLVVARQLAALRENNRLITEVRSYHEKLEHQATHDPLTGLANRSLFTTELEGAVAEVADHSLSLALIDLDDFKPVNDTFGHHVGDELLVAVAERLLSSVRPGDLVARLGGDEFAIMLRGLRAESTDEFVRRMLDTLQRPLTIEGHALTVRASVGVIDAGTAADPDRLMQRADEAMYQAKRAGKGQFAWYDAGAVPMAAKRARLIGELGSATPVG